MKLNKNQRNHDTLPLVIDTHQRRMFLKGLGAALTIPYLPSLLPKAEAATAALPIAVFTGSTHGRWHGSWYPGGVNLPTVGTNVRSTRLSSIAGPLGRTFGTTFDGLRDKINIIQGLDFLGISGHDQIIYTAANRIHYQDGLGKNFIPTFPYSADVVLSQSKTFYPVRPPLDVLRIAPRKEGGFPWEGVRAINGATIDGTSGNWLPCYGDSLARVYNYLNAYFDPTATARAANTMVSRRFLIDKVLAQFKTVAGSAKLSSADKNSLTNYTDHLTDLQRDLANYVPQVNTCGPLAAVTETSDNDVFNQKLIDMMVLSLACGVTRIATYDLNYDACAMPSGGADYHGPAGVHGCNGGANYENVANWSASFMRHYAYIIRQMDAHGLLDRSLVLYANEMSSSVPNHHGCDIPVVTAGNLGGKFRTGEFISYYNLNKLVGAIGGTIANSDLSTSQATYNLYAGRRWNEMMVSMFAAMGVPPSEYQRQGGTGFGTNSPCDVPANFAGECGNINSDTSVQRGMLDYYANDYKESYLATLPYLYLG